jgi:hypothetical protein
MRKEPVTSAGQGFDKIRLLGRVAKSLPQARDRKIQAMIEIDKSARGPELLL